VRPLVFLLACLGLTCIHRCEHYSIGFGGTRDHLFSYDAGSGLYDVEYLEALFENDTDEIARIEKVAFNDGFGPLTACSTIWNNNSVKVHCREFNIILFLLSAQRIQF
jgi:hypothetical protein